MKTMSARTGRPDPIESADRPHPQDRWHQLHRELSLVYGTGLVMAARAQKRSDRRLGTLSYLQWLHRVPKDAGAHAVFRVFAQAGPDLLAERDPAEAAAYERAFFDSLVAWHTESLATSSHVSPKTVSGYARGAAWVFEALAGKYPGIPAAFRADSLRLPEPTASSKTNSLGMLTWPELSGLQGTGREREALKIARKRYCDAFIEEENAFQIGRQLLEGGVPVGADAAACSRVRAVLVYLDGKFRRTGKLIGSELVHDSRLRGSPELDINLWRDAGMSVRPSTSVLRGPCQTPFMPSRRMLASAIGVFICDTGWNVQPVVDLPANPFLFRSSDAAFVATPGFIEGYKERAGHHVLAYLGEGGLLAGSRLEMALDLWKGEAEQDGAAEGSYHAELSSRPVADDLSSLEVMARYRAIAEVSLEAIKSLPQAAALNACFWIGGAETGLSKLARPDPGAARIPLEGLTYQSIRKTVQIIRLDETGSVRAVARGAGHTGTSVIMPHYLNAPHIAAQLDRNIRDFQDAIQGLFTRDLDQKAVSNALGLSEVSLAEMRSHAKRAGIAGALGLDPIPENPNPLVVFRLGAPDQESLRDLYLTHRALQELRFRTQNHRRYRVRFLPMLAIAKAIGKTYFQNGYGPRYWRAARAAAAAVRRGDVALPFIGE